MDTSTATEIIKNYRASLARGAEGETVLRRLSLLPCTKARIKYTYFVVIENLIFAQKSFPLEVRKQLVEEYTLLAYFIDDNLAVKYSNNYQEWQSKKSSVIKDKKAEMLMKQYIGFTHLLKSTNSEDEINGFIDEVIRSK